MRDWPFKFAMTAFLVSFAAVLVVSLPGCQTANTFRHAIEQGVVR
jgi:outer membrane protein assembly factor BamE (lipoprotein component of BamABCDE complex)